MTPSETSGRGISEYGKSLRAEKCAIDLGDGLTYVERAADWRNVSDPYLAMFWHSHAVPSLVGELHLRGESAPVSYIFIERYVARIGSVSIEVEGFSSGATVPKFRGRGLFSSLMREAMKRASARVCLVFLKGIDGFYDRLGFVPCIPERKFRFNTSAVRDLRLESSISLRPWSGSDGADACHLYNEVNSLRPGTAVRNVGSFPGARATTPWEPGDHAIVAERNEKLVGYAFVGHLPYGQSWRQLEVRELVCCDIDAAKSLLKYIGDHATRSGKAQIFLDDPEDSVSGTVLKSLDCEHSVRYSRDGGWMAAMIDRDTFATSVAPELRRRFADNAVQLVSRLRQDGDKSARGALLQLLLGMASWTDYIRLSDDIPGPTASPNTRPPPYTKVPLSFIHSSDRY